MTEQAIGRVMDADFAAETTNLSKQQILNQAANSMLAQANQSKQSILALLQWSLSWVDSREEEGGPSSSSY